MECRIGVVLALVLSAVVCLSEERGKCSSRDLKGNYGFSLDGSNTGVGPYAIVGTFASDGIGQFAGNGTQSVNGKIVTSTFSGTYTLRPTCEGSAILTFGHKDTAKLTFVVVQRGKRVFFIDSDPGTIETGTAEKQ